MSERLILLVLVLSGIFFILRKYFSNKPDKTNIELDFLNDNSGFPTILYFWTEKCTQCFNLQKPAISELKKEQIKFKLISVNALEKNEIVKKLNIKTVPTTVVLSETNEVKFINNGFVSKDLLASQLKLS
jgi:thioredoxin-like negative regulator of GroEL